MNDCICDRCAEGFIVPAGYEFTKYCCNCAQEIADKFDETLAEVRQIKADLEANGKKIADLLKGLEEAGVLIIELSKLHQQVEKYMPQLVDMANQIISPENNFFRRMVTDFKEAMA